jgi:DinB superfamily
MGPKDVIKQTLDMSDFILDKYLSDLSDADLRLRPIEGMNPIALQLGHLVVAEQAFNNMINPGTAPELPVGFKEAHDLKNKELSDAGFVGKEKYVELLKAQRAATLATLSALSDSELDDTRDGKLPTFAPTVGALLTIAGAHALGHYGQFVAVRRMLKKPVLF